MEEWGDTSSQARRTRRRRSYGENSRVNEPQQQQNPLEMRRAYLTRYKKERVQIETYEAAINHHQNAIKNKVVLDVGCGSGILSILCAKAGAKRVYAVEVDPIAWRVETAVQENRYPNIVKVLHGRIEGVDIKEEVDVIISDWMGSMLVHESMLGSVIFARDRWLKHGGLILPSNAMLYVAPFSNPARYKDAVEFWKNVSGINMSAMIPLAKQIAFAEPSVETISNENIAALSQVVKYIDCYSITIPQLESIKSSFKFNSRIVGLIHGFAFWFDVEFSGVVSTSAADHLAERRRTNQANPNAPPLLSTSSPEQSPTESPSAVDHLADHQGRNQANPNAPPPNAPPPNAPLLFSTSPELPPTRWKQTLIDFYEPIQVVENELIEGSVTLSQRQENARFLNVDLEFTIGDQSYVKNDVMR